MRSQNQPPRSARRGLMILMALAVMVVASMTMVSLIMFLRADGVRTQDARIDAQLRQLLLAGAQDATHRARAWDATAPTRPWTITLPPALAAEGAGLQLQPLDSAGPSPQETLDIEVDASYGLRRATQTLRFHHAPGGWRLAALGASAVH